MPLKKKDIQIGGHYVAKVGNNITTVRVDAIREVTSRRSSTFSGRRESVVKQVYDVTNLATGRKTTFQSAAKFRAVAKSLNVALPSKTRNKKQQPFRPKTDPTAVGVAKPAETGTASTVESKPHEEDKKCADPIPSAPMAASTSPASSPDDAAVPSAVQEGENCADPMNASNAGIQSEVPGCVQTVKNFNQTSPCKKSTMRPVNLNSNRPSKPPSNDLNQGELNSVPIRSSTTSIASVPSAPLVSPLANVLRRSKVNAEVDNAPHLIVQARAGCGKTTTLIEGLKKLKGLPTSIEPSPQQQAIWDSICLSHGARTVCFCAFNKAIAEELKTRIPPGCEAMTMHSMGFRAVTRALGKLEPSDWVVKDIIAEIKGVDLRKLRQDKPIVLKATEQLVSLCKMNLIGPFNHGLEGDSWDRALDDLATYYDVDLNGCRVEVFDLVPRVLERCKQPRGKITYDDMIWLPVVLDLPVFKYDLLLVDEAQDLNRCQQELAKRAGSRLVMVGDDKQAIYQFSGSDSESMKRMARELSPKWVDDATDPQGAMAEVVSTERGCVTLPLTVTRRCGKAIVKEAQKYVPEFEAHDSNPEGRVLRANLRGKDKPTFPIQTDGRPLNENHDPECWNYASQCQDGDFVLCRANAPLVSECFRFLRSNRKATIRGRDIGAGLISLVEKLAGTDPSIPHLLGRLGDWLAAEQGKESAKRFPSEGKMNNLQDKHDCLACFCEGEPDVAGVKRRIEAIFTDDKTSPGIRLSSIHKAKGLEAKRVFILQPPTGRRRDRMQAWELEQESNLAYVAITRAIEELVFVS